MIREMRELAILELSRRFGTAAENLGALRQTHGERLAEYLVEAGEKISKVYLLQAIGPGTVRMWAEDLDDRKRRRLPFNKPSGSQSAAIGPVLKRTFKRDARPPYGPTPKIQKTTQESFEVLSKETTFWAPYFGDVCEVLFRARTLQFDGKTMGVPSTEGTALNLALSLIPEKETVFLSVADAAGRWPGDRPEYHAYLAETLAETKYVTGEAPKREGVGCPLCGAESVTVYANAVKGAGFNFANVDRAGSFPGLDTGAAWKGFGLCLDCADSLYVFRHHLLGEFVGSVAGEKALVLPSLIGPEEAKAGFLADWRAYVEGIQGGQIKSREAELLEFGATRDDAQVVLQILWATFGQVVDDVRGSITDVLPSRLQTLVGFNNAANAWSHALAPRHELDEARFDLSLSFLRALLYRPGGKKAKKSNASQRLFELRRQVAEALYYGRPLGRTAAALWEEILETAGWYLTDAVANGNAWGLVHEGVSTKGGKSKSFWTLAGWIRHVARFLFYLDRAEVLTMGESGLAYTPKMEKLRPYFERGSGIDSPEKAFAFTLGVLYGKLLQVQGARGVNVSSNALTWLKRLNLSGRDLPEFYVKVREKLLSYGTEGSADVREILQELGRLGARLGDEIALGPVPTCYFLLLGQSVTTDVLPSKRGEPT